MAHRITGDEDELPIAYPQYFAGKPTRRVEVDLFGQQRSDDMVYGGGYDMLAWAQRLVAEIQQSINVIEGKAA